MKDEAPQRVGDYEILQRIGEGGMGAVYKVRNVISDRIEAMKVLLPNLVGKKDQVDRFLREIRVVAPLKHPNICELHTALTIQNQLVMVMEYVEGETLTCRVERGALRIPEAIDYTEQVLKALGYAHQKQIVHRDVKPGNMILTPGGIVKLTDFGIARSHHDGRLTRTGTTLGSLCYMAPEQVKNSAVDHRADLYSVGICLYEFVTGRKPFEADSELELMTAQVHQMPQPPVELRSEVSKDLSNIILKALSKGADQRFQSAEAFGSALKRLGKQSAEAGDGEVSERDSSALVDSDEIRHSRSRNLRVIYMVLGALIAMAVMVAAGIYWPHKRSTSAHERTVSGVQPAAGGTQAESGASNASSADPARSPLEGPQDLRSQGDGTSPAKAERPADTGHPGSPANHTAHQQNAAGDSALSSHAAVDSGQLQALEERTIKLEIRAKAVNGRLDQISQQNGAAGLRPDLISGRETIKTYLSSARGALQSMNVTAAASDLDTAEIELAKLEGMLNIQPNR